MNPKNDLEGINRQLFEAIREIVEASRRRVFQHINIELTVTYWKIGEQIVAAEKKNGIDQKTSRQIILELAKVLTDALGKGFYRSNLYLMRKFYKEYPEAENVRTLFGQLSWAHICELMVIENSHKRSFYLKECVNAGWSFRELKRQISSSLYERLLLSAGKSNKEKVLHLALKGQEIARAEDLIKNPYVFEFLGLPGMKPMMEKELEEKLIRHIEDFLLELGKGFMFVGSQQRITLGNTHYYVDMVFYNKILRSYILVELKTSKLSISDAGQLNTYLNYYKTEVNEASDNPPIGIILCTEKDDITAEYILGGFENSVFASRYTTILPDKDLLIQEVENVIINDNNPGNF